MQDEKYKYLFGPVNSRRLGLSLGVDIVPFKTCSYNCVYCQLGRTKSVTLARKEYVKADDVLEEVGLWLKEGSRADYITFSGSGEPTLNSKIGTMILRIKELTDTPVCVLTNGSLLHLKEVRDAIMGADLVIPSLDAGCEDSFRKINRPDRGVIYSETVEGLIKFAEQYRGKIYLEVFLVDDINTGDMEIAKIRDIALKVNPDRIELNTVSRPTAEEVRNPDDERLNHIQQIIGPKAFIIGNPGEGGDHRKSRGMEEVMSLLRRRPCTIEDIAKGLCIDVFEAKEHVENLKKKRILAEEIKKGKLYYYWKH